MLKFRRSGKKNHAVVFENSSIFPNALKFILPNKIRKKQPELIKQGIAIPCECVIPSKQRTTNVSADILANDPDLETLEQLHKRLLATYRELQYRRRNRNASGDLNGTRAKNSPKQHIYQNWKKKVAYRNRAFALTRDMKMEAIVKQKRLSKQNSTVSGVVETPVIIIDDSDIAIITNHFANDASPSKGALENVELCTLDDIYLKKSPSLGWLSNATDDTISLLSAKNSDDTGSVILDGSYLQRSVLKASTKSRIGVSLDEQFNIKNATINSDILEMITSW